MTDPSQPDRRTQIVEAAFACVATGGIAGLRMRDVANRAGVNIATVHYYLTSKAELIRAVVEHAHRLFAVHATPVSGDDPVGRLRVHLDAVVGLLERDPALARVLAEVAVECGHDSVVAEAVDAAESRWRRAMQRMLRPLPLSKSRLIAALVMLTIKGACLPPTGLGTIRAARRALDATVNALASEHAPG